ncbi:GL18016 [Drosophila persimilis]|uniref:GL18016 n=1 Tax=Drosophila persimilis TaxID=7234 RepID=B4H263_DROPE|nr:GL18016 [Drosophila persimilis]
MVMMMEMEMAMVSPLLPAPAPLLPAPAPLPHHLLPAATPFLPPAELTITHQVLPPVLEAAPFATPTYRAIPGPKTTTHHVSIGYAFPKLLAHAHAHPHPQHAHLRGLPLTKLIHKHHHSLF